MMTILSYKMTVERRYIRTEVLEHWATLYCDRSGNSSFSACLRKKISQTQTNLIEIMDEMNLEKRRKSFNLISWKLIRSQGTCSPSYNGKHVLMKENTSSLSNSSLSTHKMETCINHTLTQEKIIAVKSPPNAILFVLIPSVSLSSFRPRKGVLFCDSSRVADSMYTYLQIQEMKGTKAKRETMFYQYQRNGD